MTTADQAYAELIQRSKEASTLLSCSSVLGWDERTYMPREGSAHRGEQMALLAKLSHNLATDPRLGELLTSLEESSLVLEPLSVPAVNIREIRRNYERATKLPGQLVEELARVTTLAQAAWDEARKHNDYSRFQLWLEKIVALKQDEAQAIGYEGHPYDALLDEYEPGATTTQIRQVFADLGQELVPLIHAIAEAKQRPNTEILHRWFPVERQQVLGREAAEALGFDFAAGRLDVTTHPFCSGIGPGDCRITTRYNEHFFNESFFGILHEAGHAIYEQGLDPKHYGTPMGTAVSLGIHESQSRLWENQVGRSLTFWEWFYPKTQLTFDAFRDVSLQDFYFAINAVEPVFIRVEADEATYNLHIILRFELEQALLTGDLPIADVPGAWNSKFKELLGLTPPDFRRGCLQDIHWSFGGLGYFPTYTLGNLYAAQFMEQARIELQDGASLEDDIRKGQFGRLKDWLNEKVHRPGQRYRAVELCRQITGNGLDHRPLIAYLRNKYMPLYGL